MSKGEAFRVGLVGNGRIGREVRRRVERLGSQPVFVKTRSGLEVPGGGAKRGGEYPAVDLVYLAIPTEDDGRAAKEYIEHFLSEGAAVVTCEKGALSEYYAEFAPRLERIGLSATVGGGTRMLGYVRERVGRRTQEVHAVINGTLNFIMDGVASGRTMGQMVAESRLLGYAEPGRAEDRPDDGILDVINGEACGDLPKKATILFNHCLGKVPVRASKVRTRALREADLDELERHAKRWRYIVSFLRTDEGSGEAPGPGGFVHQADGWEISGGFRNIDENPLFVRLVPHGVDNAVLVSEGSRAGDGQYAVSGPGAGPAPTAASMLLDGRRLAERRRRTDRR